MWKYWAVLSAIFASATALLAKAGVKGIDSNLATAVRTTVVLVFAWAVAFGTCGVTALGGIGGRNWVFLVLSGFATGASWLCYFKALELGEVSKVAPIDKLSVALTILCGILIFHETLTWKVALGGAFILLGSLVLLW